jgi:hypothetical protein
MHTTRFWNNIHQLARSQKTGKPDNWNVSWDSKP